MTQQNKAGSQAEALRRMGALIAARRRALGLTQKQLAARLLVSDKAVSKWELGGGYPDPALLAPLAAALDLTVDELLAGRQAETEKVSGPLPEQTTPGREQSADPAADVWLRRRLDQNMAFWALAGLLLGGAGTYLPCLINTQLAWAVSGLVLVEGDTGYSDLAVLPSGEIAVVCERDGYTVCEVIVVAPEQIFGQCTR